METAALRVVVTGDVVGSTALGRRLGPGLPALMKETYGEIRRLHPDALPFDIDVYGGDSWQIYVADPVQGMTVALFMRARLREELDAEVRAVVALDQVDFLEPDNVSESNGPAFQRSGRALTELGKTTLLRFVLPERDEAVDAYRVAADGIADLLDHVAQQWTPAQAQAVAHMIIGHPDEPRQQDVAARWRPDAITQPAVNKHLRNAGWEWIARALDRYRTLTRFLVRASRAEASGTPGSPI